VQDERVPLFTQGVILLIEDDLEDVELFRLALAHSGCPYKLISFQFARDAIKYLGRVGEYRDEKQYPKPSLIVLDLSLPGMHGFDFLQWASGEPPETIPPIVVLSYSTLETDRQTAEKLGAKAYFAKSTNLEETVAIIKSLPLPNAPLPTLPGTVSDTPKTPNNL
jgi:CheY-like chemotaxis protein